MFVQAFAPIFKITMSDGGYPHGLIYGCYRDMTTGECGSVDTIPGGYINEC